MDRAGPSRMGVEELRPAPLRIASAKRDVVSKDTENTMTDPPISAQQPTGGPSSRNNPVRLSRRTAVRRPSARNVDTTTERRDSQISTRFPVTTTFHLLAIQSTARSPPTSRRFSFDQEQGQHPKGMSDVLAGRKDTTCTSTIPDPKDAVRMPRDLRGPVSSSMLEGPHDARTFINFSLPRPPSQAQQVEESDEGEMELQEVEVKQRHVPTTFEAILGKRGVPTALLEERRS
ncbi:hypothetical protein BDW02DRAFT_99357 [Decorospora gaudefroyi]|uniref:Uncharacterized protein n=1 Tax=Decorospora gaudefroyi TaxID=184978 RepID=A0A6A5K6Q7_9PLEO|nr:hypothetical protein BDW02DRAFT_99357 [Decorospora gaudefroyi]